MTSHGPIRVLMVEDSKTVEVALAALIGSDPRLKLIQTVSSGEQALAFLQEHKPDVILMDIHLPGMNGFEATRRIMSTRPVPIVICSATSDTGDVATTFQAIEAGALALAAKPRGPAEGQNDDVGQQLLETLRLMSEVKVVRRWDRASRGSGAPFRVAPARGGACEQVVAIGASTGGPPVLRTLLAGLPSDFPFPLLVVQHIALGFLPGLAEWLQQSTTLPVHIATHGEPLAPGHVYFAPDGRHLGVDSAGRVALAPSANNEPHCPSAGYLFRAVAEVYGANAIGVLLTGMGRDGASELLLLRDRGATTIAQDKATSVVHGMPGEAIRLGAATHILPAQEIAGLLTRLARLSCPNPSPPNLTS